MPVIKAGWIIVFLISLLVVYTGITENISGAISKRLIWAANTDSVLPGKRLALQYCGMCHLFPDPSLLDKKTWIDRVLPNMGLRLGINETGKDPYADLLPEEQPIMRKLNVYPSTPLITQKDWDEIVKYFEQEAPEAPLPQKKHDPISDTCTLFLTKQISFDDKPLPKTTMLKFNSASNETYIGDGQHKLYILDNHFNFKSAWNTESAPVDISFRKGAAPLLLTIGSFSPSDQQLGRLLSFDTSFTTPIPEINIDHLSRPVQFACADLNMDGKDDAVICNFGNNGGKLAWYDDFQASKENILKALPGARKVEIKDFNGDGKPDIIVLMSQAWEGISLFYNLGKGKFKEKKLLQFSPVFGASYFELADFNKDGHPDILLTNGDNWDYSAINKNYHGVRIYLNDGKDNFKEAWFYPLYGTSKAVAADFDNDGDMDIAAIAFYADLEHPENGFVYFSNEGNFYFKSSSLPDAALGKWLTMEAADFDHDGDTDIVLGSYFHTVGELSKLINKGTTTTFPQLLVLTNTTK
ncbi:VCBS repeat-containing protein [Agriterribacter sp.]|uniref:FG-GAP repeat domain-containing protein n=1 Tax=Agriterribacter sp. TaxID=2821509 RepID=UPI002B5E15DE|nr:VCBS repeat-containing protein [Agriterribacter sp.]HTN08655.1 VCBS repeat-containing protein [Agriterribacter sp.]